MIMKKLKKLPPPKNKRNKLTSKTKSTLQTGNEYDQCGYFLSSRFCMGNFSSFFPEIKGVSCRNEN